MRFENMLIICTVAYRKIADNVGETVRVIDFDWLNFVYNMEYYSRVMPKGP